MILGGSTPPLTTVDFRASEKSALAGYYQKPGPPNNERVKRATLCPVHPATRLRLRTFATFPTPLIAELNLTKFRGYVQKIVSQLLVI